MRKKAILALVLVSAMLLSSCALVEKDMAVDNATVIVELGDKTVTKLQVSNTLEYQLQYMAYMYSMYGMNYDPTDPTTRAQALDSVISGLAEELVKQQKQEELGLTELTPEEDTAAREKAQTSMDSQKDIVKTQFFADTKLEGEALDAAILKKMEELGYTFDEYFYKNAKTDAVAEKLRNYIIKDITVTDDEIKTEYDTRVEAAKTSYASDLSSYGSTVNSNGIVYYAPAGYRYVKHILRKFSDEVQANLTDLNSKITAKTTEITNVDTSITGLGESVAQDDPARVQLNEQKAALEKEKADLQAQYDKALADAYAVLQPSVDEVLGKIAAGEDFDALMATYGEDPGMQTSPQKETGYAVCEGFTPFDPAFTSAAMILKNVGDVSPAIHGQSGIHIIKYVSDIAEGAVALDKVKESISSELLTTKQDDTYNTQITTWVEESGVKTYKDRMN